MSSNNELDETMQITSTCYQNFRIPRNGTKFRKFTKGDGKMVKHHKLNSTAKTSEIINK